MAKISIGVIGSGVFGRYHALKCVGHPDVTLTGIYSPAIDQGEGLAREVSTDFYHKAGDLIAQSDAIIIACPAIHHAAHAMECLQAKRHVLVEKPLATERADARKIVDLARAGGLCLQVGHQERFVVRAIGLDRVPETPRRIVGRRLNPFSVRGTDTSVTLDLMTHDLDLVFWLMKAEPERIIAYTQAVRSELPDAALALLKFPEGSARLEASRIEQASQRDIQIVYPSGEVRIDFNSKSLDNRTDFDLNPDFPDHPDVRDSLNAGLNEFVAAIRDRRRAFIDGEAGLAAVSAALEIDRTGFGR